MQDKWDTPREKPESVRQRQDRVLEALVDADGDIKRACAIANISRSTFYRWFNGDPTFKDAYDQALEVVLSELHSTLFPRARKSDRLLIFVLENRFRSLYGRRLEVKGDVVSTSLDPERLKELTDEELTTLRRLAERVARPVSGSETQRFPGGTPE